MTGTNRTMRGVQNPEARRDVFISYRRNGGSDFAKILDDRLEQAAYNVFFDVEHLRSGKFNEKLYFFIENCQDFLLVLPRNALKRCSDPEDWLRKEIECALQNGIPIIPIMLRGFKWPDPATLPESLRELHLFNALQQPSNEYFDASMEKLTLMMHAKPYDIGVGAPSYKYPKSPLRIFLERLALALAILAIGIGGTLAIQRAVPSGQESIDNVQMVTASAAQPSQTIATDAPAYAQAFQKGGAVDQAVREKLGMPEGAPLQKDVESITEINLSGRGLTDISEVSALTGLTTLDLHNNKITDLTPLTVLTKLETLLLYDNRIVSLQPLSGLTLLTELSAENNRIADVAPLAGLTTLKKLYLQNNQITDVSPIRNLVNLTRLVLDGNPATDYTSLRNFDTTVFQTPKE
ncbi:MAG TPA: leucine-rich repeat domain-containing protein [Candidatus Limiplasma sp.]|nr:leucine-rich repeat domain-containing protein [Candidatus Limiplasma sp.]